MSYHAPLTPNANGKAILRWESDSYRTAYQAPFHRARSSVHFK